MLDVIEQNRARIADLCRRFGVRRLDVFGSASRVVDFDPATSDVDLFYEFEDYGRASIADDFFSLQEALSSVLDLPVDLVSARNVSNRYFLESANRDRVTLYAAADAQAVG